MLRLSMALRFKLGGAFTIFLVVFFGSFSLYHLHALNEEVHSSLENDLALLTFTSTGREMFGLIRHRILEGARSQDFQRLAETLPEIDRLQQFVRSAKGLDFRQLASHPALVAQLDLYVQEIATLSRQIVGSEPAPLLEILAANERILDTWRAMEGGSLTLFSVDQNQIAKVTKSLQIRMAILAIAIILGAIVLSFFFGLQIKLPIRRLRDLIHAIRDGNYEVTVRSQSHDELGQVYDALAHMAQHIAIRDRLKIEKIGLEKKRFAALANHLDAPLMLINGEHKIAFANNQLLEFFRLTWDDVNEVDLALAGVPSELKARIDQALKTHEWPLEESMDLIGENYAYEMHLTFIPVPDEKGHPISLVAILGRIAPVKPNAA